MFEPWHLGDVAIALSVAKRFAHDNCEFVLVCDGKWKDWALSTGVLNAVIEFAPPWTHRRKRKKYNPFNYKARDVLVFRKRVAELNPDLIIDLRGDIRANLFLNFLFGGRIKIISSKLPSNANVYRREEVLQKQLNLLPIEYKSISRPFERKIALFFGAADKNRIVPWQQALKLLIKLHDEGYFLTLILQPSDNFEQIQKIKESQKLSNLNLIMDNVVSISKIIVEASLVVSTDSGWLHVAHFYGKPTIGLFGFDTINTWLPPGSLFFKANTMYPANYRYKNKHKALQPLSDFDVDKFLEVLHLYEKTNSETTQSFS